MGANKDILGKLFEGTFHVHLPKANFEVACRDLPFVTFMDVLAEVVSDADNLISGSKERFSAAFVEAMKAAERAKSESKSDETTKAAIGAALEILTPSLIKVIQSVPHVTSKFVTSVVIDATEEHVRALSTEDVLCLLSETLDRTDNEYIAERLEMVFQKATTITQLVKDRVGTSNLPEQPASPSQTL